MVLAHFAQGRHVSPSPSTSPFLSHRLLNTLDTLDNGDLTSFDLPVPLEFSYTNLSINDDFYCTSRQSTPYTHSSFPSASSSTETQLMTDTFVQNPRLRVQQSTPSGAGSPYSPPPMSAGSQQPQVWENTLQDWSHLSPHNTQQQYSQVPVSAHKRLSSESSIGSAGPASPYTQPAAFPHIVDTETQSVNSPQLESLENSYASAPQFTKPLPAYANPLSNGSLYPQAYNFVPHTDNAGQYIAQQSAMRSAARGQGRNNMSGGQNMSAEQSFGADFEGSGEMRNAPKLDRTISDVYEDELYNPSMQAAPAASQTASQSPATASQLLSPSYRQTFHDRRQAADAARSASPTSSMARDPSPFRENSRYAAHEFAPTPNSPARINSAQQLRQAQRMQADAQAYQDHHPQFSRQDFASSNTISPQEVSLDYHESEHDAANNFPLFPPPTLAVTTTPTTPTEVKLERAITSLVHGQRSQTRSDQIQHSARSGPSSYPSASSTSQATSQFTFMPPSVPSTNGPNTYPFISHFRRPSSSMRAQFSDQVPDFPATLPSMESTRSDGGAGEMVRPPGFSSPRQSHSHSEPSSQEAQTSSSSPLPRPHDTSANAGTYTCTAPACTARFDTSANLQKHRRETHPQTHTAAIRSSASPAAGPSSPANPSSATISQAAANNGSSNNQPGPHRCEKINPSTGKPCNKIFSRSYDLTRHEDTIHSNRKHKVRCHLCTEEKTFSRNDALTRHMRVVHPEAADMGGKGRRGGRLS